ncbi:MAG: polysaccharide pyruvyl transferase family protein [Pseudomonadota bacterium]
MFSRFRLDPSALALTDDGQVPLIYWRVKPNFGDLLAPWLFQHLTGREVKLIKGLVNPVNLAAMVQYKWKQKPIKIPHYISIGSIMSRVKDNSIVWGTGSFGTEQFTQLSTKARYCAVRGPLSRQLLRNVGVEVPQVYGDPALLTPLFFDAPEEKTHKIGLVLRWSETEWLQATPGDGVTLIDLGSRDVEGTLHQILSCEMIITSSLHGLIIADTYGIPNAYLASDTPKGGEFKFYDYFASVNKFRKPKAFDFTSEALTVDTLMNHFDFDGREIDFDAINLLRACPFLEEV